MVREAETVGGTLLQVVDDSGRVVLSCTAGPGWDEIARRLLADVSPSDVRPSVSRAVPAETGRVLSLVRPA